MDAEDNGISLTTAQHIPLAIYCCVATVLGLLGNSVVLYSSFRYNALKLDDVSLMFVRNLAFADMGMVLCRILPTAITYIQGEYILGDTYCFITAHFTAFPSSANALTVFAITAYRLCLLTPPYRAISKATARGILVVIWIISTAPTTITLGYGAQAVYQNTYVSCVNDAYKNSSSASTAYKIAMIIIVMIPLFATIFINIILSVISIRHSKLQATVNRRGKKNHKALILVCSVAGLFTVSWVPLVIYQFASASIKTQALSLLAFHCLFLNAFGNPILYAFTNQKFGAYMRNVLNKMVCRPSLINMVSSQSNTESQYKRDTRDIVVVDVERRVSNAVVLRNKIAPVEENDEFEMEESS